MSGNTEIVKCDLCVAARLVPGGECIKCKIDGLFHAVEFERSCENFSKRRGTETKNYKQARDARLLGEAYLIGQMFFSK